MLDIQEASPPPVNHPGAAANGTSRSGGGDGGGDGGGGGGGGEETIQQSIINIDSGVHRRPRLASHEYDVSKERKRSKR